MVYCDAVADVPTLSVFLRIRLTNGNEGRSKKWFKSDELRKEYEMLFVLERMSRKPFLHPVVVHVTRILGKRESFWDSSSIGRGNYKEIEDALVAVGWFVDDGPKWIVETRFFQDSSRRAEGPATLIEIFEQGNVS